MTVCVAAVASSGGVIICVADKTLSYGDHLVWESDSTKIIPLNGGKALALTAGSEIYIRRLLRKIESYEGYRGDLQDIISFVEGKYRECFEEMQDIDILVPHGISRQDYVAAMSSPGDKPLIGAITDQMVRYKNGFDCELLICGFCGGSQPYLLSIGPPGAVTDYTGIGFHAIGEGAPSAVSRLLFVEHRRSDGVAHTLFDCFDAKAHAEMSPNVGFEWDGYFITGDGSKPMAPEAKPLIDRVWAARNKSPFRKTKEVGDLPRPPKDWEMRLRHHVADSFPGSVIDNLVVVTPGGDS